MNFEAAAIHLWYQDGNRNQFKDATESTQHFYLDRAHAVIEAAVGDTVLYREMTEDEMKERLTSGEGVWCHPIVQVYPEKGVDDDV